MTIAPNRNRKSTTNEESNAPGPKWVEWVGREITIASGLDTSQRATEGFFTPTNRDQNEIRQPLLELKKKSTINKINRPKFECECRGRRRGNEPKRKGGPSLAVKLTHTSESLDFFNLMIT